MEFWVGGNHVDLGCITFRKLGFSERLRFEGQPYILEVSVKDLDIGFRGAVDSFVRQCEIDDAGQGYADIPELKEFGYPGFESLCDDFPGLLELLVSDYLYFDFLGSVFNGCGRGASFVINSLDVVVMSGAKIKVAGRGFTKGQV